MRDARAITAIGIFPSGTYRLVYTVKIGEVVYALHAFQKKSHSGIATPKAELDLIARRLRQARKHCEAQTTG